MSAIVQPASPGRWFPTPLVAGSIALHFSAPVVVLFDPALWPWMLAAIAANHGVFLVLGMWPRSTMLGPNITRLPAAATARGEIALTFDDGPDPEVTPKVLDILEARGVRATFFCIAEKAARNPELTREIARRGHAIENHSRLHMATFAFFGSRGFRRDISAAQQILTEQAGRAPRFFRPPMGFRNPMLDPVLHDLGLKLVSWSRRGYDTRRCDAGAVAARLESGLGAGAILLLHDGHCARSPSGQPVVLEVLPRLLDAIERQGLKPVTIDQAVDP